jgi:Cdc6-like AAA superfamily ATPase
MQASTCKPHHLQLHNFIHCFVEHPNLTRVLESWERLFKRQPLGGEQSCMLLTGDAGTGKSYLINQFVMRHPSYQEGDVLIRPVIKCRIPSRPNVESMMVQMLSDLGQFGAESRKGQLREVGLTETLIKILKKCQTRIIIINEFQELIEFKSIEDRQRVANRLKMINEEAGIPIVLVGMPWAAEITEEPQWASRLMSRIELPYFKISSCREEYIRFLKGLSLKMGFDTPPNLAMKEISIPLFAACSGQVRILKKILNVALEIALEDSAQTIDKQHLAMAVDIELSGQDENPFKIPLSKIKISEVSRYARYNPNAVSREEALIKTQFADALSLAQILRKN